LHLPFSIYDTFVIEERYGFNKTTPRTFVLDILKSLLLAALLGGPVLAGIFWFFGRLDASAWLYCWGAVTAVQMLLAFAGPALIMPLFNKFTPLAAGELRTAIETYAASQDFTISEIFVMDGSRRSGKSNAFFSGFGRFRRLVLFDTLIERNTVPELLAVLAHEMGHFKERHIQKSLLLSVGVTGVYLFLLSFFIHDQRLAQAFGLEHARVYAGLFFFGFLFSPISMLLSAGTHALSRRWEFAADAYARKTAKVEDLAAALKKLSVDNLANLTPHPFKVLLSYTHPPILQRLDALKLDARETVAADPR
jgi:STE24 endopeptidase